MKISIQGVKGSFHDIVARKKFGAEINTLERDSFKEVFADVGEGRAGFGVIAIENSIAGSILENFDLLLKHDLYIVGEDYQRISHQLMALPGTELSEIEEVWSHPMAIKQCEDYLAQHPDWIVIEKPDTAGSAKMIRAEHKLNTAAIASELAAATYELDILAAGIETNKDNYTRFLIISKEKNYSEEADKTSIVFTAEDKPGSLAKVMMAFAEAGLNLTKIESRPIIGKSWKYYFYLDFEAGVNSPKTKKVFENILPYVQWFRVLGSYTHATLFRE